MNNSEKIDNIKNNISLLQDFICPDFPDLGIYSHQYSKHIIFDIYSHLPKDTLYCYTYMDFDKLSVINEEHGKEVGDIALHNALKIIKSCLPKDALFGRIGGDEFYIITPNVDKKTADELYSRIGTTLDYYRSKVYGLTVTLSTEPSFRTINDTVHYKSFENLQKITEKRVSASKLKNKKDVDVLKSIFPNDFIELSVPENISSEQQEAWKKLNSNVSNVIRNHLRELRPSKEFRYDNKHIVAEALSIITALSELIEFNLKEKKINESGSQFNLPPKDASLIHDLFNNLDLDLTNLSDEELLSLKNTTDIFFESLIRDCHSGLLSKSYYNLFLADKLETSDTNYQAAYFSISGIRPSNSAYGHAFTDARMQRTAEALKEIFLQKRKFNNSSFSYDENDAFLTDQGGGNYLAFIPMEQALSDDEINEIVESINSSNNLDDPSSTFLIASVHANDINSEAIKDMLTDEENSSKRKPFVKFARHLKGKCNIEKDNLKEHILSGVDNKIAFRKALADVTDFYTDNIENADDINTKKLFLTNIFTSLVNQEVFHNKELDDEQPGTQGR